MTEAELLQGLAAGSIVIPWNPRHKNLKPVAIGKGATTQSKCQYWYVFS